MAIDNKFANTRAVSIGELLSQRKIFKVPRFQRNYSWGEDSTEALWNDMTENFRLVANNSQPVPDAQYLLGPVVLVSNENQNEFLVIDGQQRLATLTMLFCVTRDIMYEYSATDGIDKINELISNKFMGKHSGWKLELNDTDRKLFLEIQEYEPDKMPQIDRFKDSKNKKSEKHTKSQKLLVKNYKFLHSKMLKFLDSLANFDKVDNAGEIDLDVVREHRKNNIPMMIHFVDFICTYNYVIMVVVNDDSTAFQIFETLNDRGQTLSKSNLIKNHILNKTQGEEMQRKQSERWNRIFDEVVGTDQRDDDFIMESYDSRQGDNKSLRSEISEPPPMSKKNLYKIIKEMVKDEESCERLIRELDDDSVFLSMLNAPEKYHYKESKDDIIVIKALKAKFIRVPLLAAHRKWYDKTPETYSKFVKFLVKFFFKTRIVRQEHPGAIEKFTKEAVEMINTGKSYDDVVTMLKKHDDHKDFIYKFENAFVDGVPKDTAKYVLREFTLHLGTNYDDVHPIDGLTLEHILPQKHNDHWKIKDFFDLNDDDYDNDNDMDAWVNALGNMTLLKQEVNVKLQNKSFSMKKNHLDKDGKQAGYQSSQLEINKQTVCNYDKWTASIILAREKKFKKYADRIWKLE